MIEQSKQTELMFSEFSLDELTERACRVLQCFQPKDRPYYGCFSGGKDSCVIKHLATLAGVNVVWHYNNTTIDPPELFRFIKREHPDVIIEPPPMNFFKMVEIKGFPTRRARWCCEKFKESKSPVGSTIILGVRAEESARRALAWGITTRHSKTKSLAVSPILHWRLSDVWSFIRNHNLEYCQLYDEGFSRLGCIGCPMARKSGRIMEFARWPRYEMLWKRAFKRVWDKRTGITQRDGRMWFGDRYFTSWEEMWDWWLNDESLPEISECQGPDLVDLMSQ